MAAVSTNPLLGIIIPMVSIGDAGNPAHTTGFGSVSYDFQIGTYPVTNLQYTAFLNSVAKTSDPFSLYTTNMDTDANHGGIMRTGEAGNFVYAAKDSMENKPVTYVSFWDAARFTNWLSTGNTETGVYNLGGVANPVNTSITRDETAWANGGFAIASEDEWYKAAYYDPTKGGTGGYWLYPTQSDTIAAANANYGNNVGTITDVTAYAHAASYYGTIDQGGNVFEWNDTMISDTHRGWLGGAYYWNDSWMRSTARRTNSPDMLPANERNFAGFRVTVIPEPSTYAIIFGCLVLLTAILRRRLS